HRGHPRPYLSMVLALLPASDSAGSASLSGTMCPGPFGRGPFGDSAYDTPATLLQCLVSLCMGERTWNEGTTMADAIQQALQRRIELRKELELIDRFLELHEQLFGEGGRVPSSEAQSTPSETARTPAASAREQ